VERWVLLLSLMPRKLPVAQFLPGFGAPKPLPWPDGGGGGSYSLSIRSSEACDTQACSKVPSTGKCSSLSSGLTSGAPFSFSRKRPMTCSFSTRSRFLENVVGCQSGSYGLSPTNPWEQQVVVQLLQQQPLRADPVELLQQPGEQQLLGRN
jgi:hypothetical protein